MTYTPSHISGANLIPKSGKDGEVPPFLPHSRNPEPRETGKLELGPKKPSREKNQSAKTIHQTQERKYLKEFNFDSCFRGP